MNLADALELVLLYSSEGDRKFDRAACRWLGRLILERDGMTVADVQFATAALAALAARPNAASAVLRSLVV